MCDLEPAKQSLNAIRSENAERGTERPERWNQNQAEPNRGGEGDRGIEEVNVWTLDHQDGFTQTHERAHSEGGGNNPGPKPSARETRSKDRHDRTTGESENSDSGQEKRKHPAS